MRWRRWTRLGLLAVAGLAMAVALMQPQWGERYVSTPRVGAEIMIALDVSRSMLADDAPPSRLERAKAEDRPIFVSIGYSSCHWCHVMEEEVFEDDQVAEFMNRHFVCIKVDREERPDIDAVYMHAVQIITGRGGWPLSAFLTPDPVIAYLRREGLYSGPDSA